MKLIDDFSNKVAQSQSMTQEQQSVIKYGMLALLQMLSILTLAIIIGLLFGAVVECLLAYIIVGWLRKFTGGAHAKTMISCIIISTVSITMISGISVFALGKINSKLFLVAFTCVSFLISFLVIFFKAPVASKNKPIVNPEKIKRLRTSSFIFITILFALCSIMIICIYFNLLSFFSTYIYVICLSLLWQVSTLTSLFKPFR